MEITICRESVKNEEFVENFLSSIANMSRDELMQLEEALKAEGELFLKKAELVNTLWQCHRYYADSATRAETRYIKT